MTHVSEIPIQDFDVAVDDLERYEFVVSRRNATDEEERSVSPVDDLGICKGKERRSSTTTCGTRGQNCQRVKVGWIKCTLVFQDVTHLGPPREHELRHVLDDLGFHPLGHRREPFLQPDFALFSFSERLLLRGSRRRCRTLSRYEEDVVDHLERWLADLDQCHSGSCLRRMAK